MIPLYQKYISPVAHFFIKLIFTNQHGCRYSPTCSEYMRQAIQKYGIIRGGFIGLKRIFRCHPHSKHPHLDPVS
ncbi:membrane protein insertion efficiency factor YidD [Candidatus Collierbacteria bacterium]|nr:membrane protein insertion efficiency factor YidD [Candidatus Collierbacteria bacterium]